MARMIIAENSERKISHPDLGIIHIEYDPTKTRCFSIQTKSSRLNPKDMKLMLELITAALAYHKLSQEEKNAGLVTEEE